MTGLTYQDLDRLSRKPENPENPAFAIAGQNYYNVFFTGGTISDVNLNLSTPLPQASGGTGSSDGNIAFKTIALTPVASVDYGAKVTLASDSNSSPVAFHVPQVNFNNNTSGTDITAFGTDQMIISGISEIANFTGLKVSRLLVNDTSSVDAFTGLEIGSNIVSGSASVEESMGVHVGNVGGDQITDGYGIYIDSQQPSASDAYAIFYENGFSVDTDGNTNVNNLITSAFSTKDNGNVVIGTAVIATNSTSGFPWIPSMAGTPSGTPTAPYTGAAAMVVDTSANKLWIRVGTTWKFASLS